MSRPELPKEKQQRPLLYKYSFIQNDKSSRSHAVIQIQVLQRWNEDGETFYQKGVLKIVDLAGS